LRSAHAIDSDACAPARSAGARRPARSARATALAGSAASGAARSHRNAFLIFAVLVGPLGGAALYVAATLGLPLPRPNPGWALFATSLLLAPVLEELVFRGGIQELLERRLQGRLGRDGANVLTSLLFAIAHLMVAPPWLAAGVFLPSLVFGRLKQLHASLAPAMLIHAWFNACFLLALARS
jgi:membrane protease YdiL (CAAX protease family)